jgi:predicted outer membrane repeat protein
LKSSTKFAYWGNKTDTCQVACIKAFTALWRASSFRWYFNYSNNFLDGKGYDVYHIDGNLSTDGKRSLSIHCNPLKEYNNRDDYVELNFNEGSQILYLKLTSGDAYLNMENWIDGHYRFSARLNSNFFTSNILYFDIILLDRVYATFSELERMIDNAGDGALLVLDRDYCYNGGFNGEYISINKSLTIDGRGHVLNGRFKSGIFRIESGCNVTLTNIQFKNGNSGALVSYGNLTVSDCIFTSNSADYGGAIYSLGDCSIVNSQFNDNSARYYGGSVYSLNALNITDSKFKSGGNAEIVYFAQGGGDLYLKNNRMLAGSENAAIILYDVKDRQYNLQLQLVFTTGSTVKGDYVHLCQIKDGEGNVYRLGDVNVTLMGRNGAINISLGYSRALGGYLFDTSVLDYGTYELTGSLSEGNCIVKDGILYIVRKSVISASALTKVYGNNKKLTVTLKDDKGKAIKNAYLNVKLNGKRFKIKTNSKGQASLAVKLAPKTYKATITFDGNTKYYKASKNVKVVIKKATPKMTAKKKTFKLKTKVKKYTITLKNNLGKVMKKTKVTLKIKGKTYKAKTNSKGKATFKIKNLKKKGTFKATVKYKGSKYYKSVTKKVKIRVKG